MQSHATRHVVSEHLQDLHPATSGAAGGAAELISEAFGRRRVARVSLFCYQVMLCPGREQGLIPSTRNHVWRRFQQQPTVGAAGLLLHNRA